MLYNRSLLGIYFIYSSMYTSISVSQFIPSPPPQGACDECVFLFNKFVFLLSPAAQIKNLMSQLGTKQDSSKLQENL